MRFISITLSNYIGIYNGMGLYDISIDMTRCRNRITIIRGDNGSGKSTLSKAMGLFPDPNDAFIPGMPARKEIVLANGATFYKLSFIHGIKTNGDRETTKAYITKTFGESSAELNPNGNVSSYKDILYAELGLDANFAALSQLSNEDRGLADKKPAERKRFVNSIISSLEVYNGIYKTLSKRSSNYKSLIQSTVGKLNVLGDENAVNANLEDVERRINDLQDQKDQAIVDLAREQSTIQLLDPDGTIQSINKDTSDALQADEKEFRKLQAIIDSIMKSNGIASTDIERDYRRIVDRKNSLIVDNQISRTSLDSLIAQQDAKTAELNKKLIRLNQISSGESYEDMKANLKMYRDRIDAIVQSFVDIGFNIETIPSITKDEYILALETLRDLDAYISAFKSEVSFTIIQKIVSIYTETGNIPTPVDTGVLNGKLEDARTSLSMLNLEITSITSRMSLLDQLNLRPAGCNDDMCPFIRDAVGFAKENPEEKLRALEANKAKFIEDIEDIGNDIIVAEEFNNAVNRFRAIVREIDKNGSILSKMPNGEMFTNRPLFFSRLISGYSFDYMSSIYKYIDMANLLDTYKHYSGICATYESELRVYESKAETLATLSAEIDEINNAINQLVEEISPINAKIADRTRTIASLESLESAYCVILDTMKTQNAISERIKDYRARLLENSRKMNNINRAISNTQVIRQRINDINSSLAPLIHDRDRLTHMAKMITEYKEDLEKLHTDYEFLETIKFYSSPTTGIQLVFMQLYMGKIIELANELLKLLFKGQFEIQPFVINESEFRIPCLGGGYLNDDISSMSSSQIGMISMILSFALLHHSSTSYNIIKLDEIDGPLDYTNRVYFMDVLNSIMDIMHTEQCIMISHNSELQVYNSDVILLKHDESNSDYMRGNIIWSYN